MRLQEFFKVGEELAGLGEGADELHFVVEFAVKTQLLTCAVEGVTAVACEVVDLSQLGDVVIGVVAGAFFVFVGLDGGKLGLPEPED